MLGVRLEPELEEKLESLARETGRSKSYYAREAIRQYLEDREDYLKGIAALERREPTITLDELERRRMLAYPPFSQRPSPCRWNWRGDSICGGR